MQNQMQSTQFQGGKNKTKVGASEIQISAQHKEEFGAGRAVWASV